MVSISPQQVGFQIHTRTLLASSVNIILKAASDIYKKGFFSFFGTICSVRLLPGFHPLSQDKEPPSSNPSVLPVQCTMPVPVIIAVLVVPLFGSFPQYSVRLKAAITVCFSPSDRYL